jgi:hypothetical protein
MYRRREFLMTMTALGTAGVPVLASSLGRWPSATNAAAGAEHATYNPAATLCGGTAECM